MSFRNSRTTLLCLFVISAWMCCCLHLDSTCNHVSASNEFQIEKFSMGRLLQEELLLGMTHILSSLGFYEAHYLFVHDGRVCLEVI